MLEFVVDRRQLAETFSLANVDHHSDFGRLVLRFQGEFVELTDQPDRKIIDAEVPPVFKRPEEGPFSGAAETSDNNEGRRIHASGSTVSLAPPCRFREMVFSLDLRICFSSFSIMDAMDVYMSVETS